MEYNRIDNLQKKLKDDFLGYFSVAGSREIDAEPLLPRNDKTVFFTNSITTRIKPFFETEHSSLPNGGVHFVQPCLRFHNLNDTLDETFDPEYLTYFEMIGGAVLPNGIDRLKQVCTNFFSSYAGISADRIKVLCNSEDKEFISGYPLL